LNILIFRFVGGFVGGLVSRLVGGFVAWFVSGFVGGLIRRLVGGFVLRFVGWLVSGLVCWFVGGLISGFVGRFVGRFISGLVSGLIFGLVVIFGFAGVFDVSDEARVTIDVVRDGLTTTIGENDEVFSLGVVSVAVLSVTKVQVGVVVLDGVVEVVVSRALLKEHYIKMSLD
jgi:hypothetical protein